MFCVQVLFPAEFFHCDNESCILDTAPVWKTETPEKNGLIRISSYAFQLELFPVLCLSTYVQCLDDFAAKLCESRGKNAVGGFCCLPPIFKGIDFLCKLRRLSVHVQELHGC